MAAGLPVVASDFPLWREFLGNGECGLTVDPFDPSSAAQAIRWLLEHPEEAEHMGAKGRQKVLENYCWEKEAVKLLGFYDQLLNDSRG
jgi:glycosyltransferase involved in cell wall biosynthesis